MFPLIFRVPSSRVSRSVLSWSRAPPSGYLTVGSLNPKKHGSLEDQLAAQARDLRGRGIRPDFLFSHPTSAVVRELFLAAGAGIGVLDFSRKLEAARALYETVRRDYAVVHFHFVRAHDPLVLAAKAAGAKVVITDHLVLRERSGSSGGVDAIRSLARSTLGKAADLRIAVSRAVAASLRTVEQVPAGRLGVVPNGIDLRRFRIDRESGAGLRRELGAQGAPLLLCVARLHPEKGVDLLLRALARDRGALARARLLLVGDGAARAELELLTRRLGISERVRFLGLRDDLERLYPAADVVVVPSRCPEACSLVVLEAQACGVPVVAARVGGIPEMVEHQVGGILVPPEEPMALARAIEDLLEDPAARERLGSGGRAHVEQRFGLERWCRSLWELVDARLRALPPGRSGASAGSAPVALAR